MTKESASKNRFRITSIIIVVAMVIGSLGILIGPFAVNVSASITGDAYSGSGNWTITNPTVYTGETLTVYGNITITDGYLKLIGSTLTIDQPFALCRNITLSGWPGPTQPKLYVQSGSVIQSTNATSGYWNTYISLGGYSTGIPLLAVDNSTLKNMYLFVTIGDDSFINNSTLIASGVWDNAGVGYELGTPYYASIHFYNDIFKDVNVTGHAQKNVITAGSGMTIDHSTFENITLSGSTSLSATIRINAQDDVSITYNHFASNVTQVLYAAGNLGLGIDVGNFTFSHNDFDAIGSNYTNRHYSIHLMGDANNSDISHNVFHEIRNGSVGIVVQGTDWFLNGNRFDLLNSSGLTTEGSTNAIVIWAPGNGVLINGTVINNLRGPNSDIGSSTIGILSFEAGNYTISHSTIRNATEGSGGISPKDTTLGTGASVGNITIFANTFIGIYKMAGGIYFYGGGGGVISWNNFSYIGGSSYGVMLHGTNQEVLVHNNSVTNPLYGGNNELPDWQIAVGAYVVCASDIWNATFRDNHASGAVADWPSYDISQEKLGGGWWAHVEATIDVSEPTIIHTIGSNVTLVHDNQVLQVERDGTPISMTHHSNGTSRHLFAKTDLLEHWINVSATQLSLTTTGDVNITVSASPGTAVIAWNGTATAATVTFTLSGLDSGVGYKVYVDDVIMATIVAAGGQISFSYSAWSSHVFMVLRPTTYAPDEEPVPLSERSPATTTPGETPFTWTSLSMIAIASCFILIVAILLMKRPRGRSGKRYS